MQGGEWPEQVKGRALLLDVTPCEWHRDAGRGVSPSVDRNTHDPDAQGRDLIDRADNRTGRGARGCSSPGRARGWAGQHAPRQVPPGGFPRAPGRAAGRGGLRHQSKWAIVHVSAKRSRHRQGRRTSPLLSRARLNDRTSKRMSRRRCPTAARTRSGASRSRPRQQARQAGILGPRRLR